MKDKRILILFLTIFIDLLGFGIVIPILPNLAKTLAATSGMPFNPDVAVGVVAGSFSIIQFLFAPIFGAWSDRIGRRPIILMSVFVNIIGYYLFGISANFSFLLFSRVISGFGSANISAAQAYIADITAPADRASAWASLVQPLVWVLYLVRQSAGGSITMGVSTAYNGWDFSPQPSAD